MNDKGFSEQLFFKRFYIIRLFPAVCQTNNYAELVNEKKKLQAVEIGIVLVKDRYF